MLTSESRCGHIFGSACIAEWLLPTSRNLDARNTCPLCRKVLFWVTDQRVPGGGSGYRFREDGTPLSIHFLTKAAPGQHQAAIVNPILLARLAEAQMAGNQGAYDPAAEALALLRLVIEECSSENKGREVIPVTVIDDALHSLATQMGRLYDYHESEINRDSTCVSWGSEGPKVSDLRDPVWARWYEWQLQEFVFMERDEALHLTILD